MPQSKVAEEPVPGLTLTEVADNRLGLLSKAVKQTQIVLHGAHDIVSSPAITAFVKKSTFGRFPKHTTMFTVDSLRRLLTAEGFVVKEAALIGKKTHAVFIEATRRSDTE